MLAAQFGSPLVWLLLAASVVSGFLGDLIDAIAIAVILVINALVGFFQEYRAEKAISALRSMTAPRARVQRDGRAIARAGRRGGPGRHPPAGSRRRRRRGRPPGRGACARDQRGGADGRERARREEHAPRPRRAPSGRPARHGLHGDLGLDRRRPRPGVRHRMATELGRIAHLLAATEETETPLQGRLRRLGRNLLFLCVGIVGLVALLGIVRGTRSWDVFMSAVSLAVAAVPEGLPAIVTIALAIGVQRMASRQRPRPQAPRGRDARLRDGDLHRQDRHAHDREHGGARAVGPRPRCADCRGGRVLRRRARPRGHGGTGDPTELAILHAAAERGIPRDQIEQSNPRLAVTPFDPERKRMSIQRQDGVLYVKGAVEIILDRSTDGYRGSNRGGPGDGVPRAPGPGRRHRRWPGRGAPAHVGADRDRRPSPARGHRGDRDGPAGRDPHGHDHRRSSGDGVGHRPRDGNRDRWRRRRTRPRSRPGHARGQAEDRPSVEVAWRDRRHDRRRRQRRARVARGARRDRHGTRRDGGHPRGRGHRPRDDNFASIVAGIREGRGIFDNIRKSLLYLLGGNAGELALMLAPRSSASRAPSSLCRSSGSTWSPTVCLPWPWSWTRRTATRSAGPRAGRTSRCWDLPNGR